MKSSGIRPIGIVLTLVLVSMAVPANTVGHIMPNRPPPPPEAVTPEILDKLHVGLFEQDRGLTAPVP